MNAETLALVAIDFRSHINALPLGAFGTVSPLLPIVRDALHHANIAIDYGQRASADLRNHHERLSAMRLSLAYERYAQERNASLITGRTLPSAWPDSRVFRDLGEVYIKPTSSISLAHTAQSVNRQNSAYNDGSSL